MRLPNVHLRGRIFDDDVTDASNLNRNSLTLITDVQTKKVVVAAGSCLSKLQLEPISQRFTDEIVRTTGLGPRVLVGVDHIPTRWAIQRHQPDWLSVGATSHFGVLVSSHKRGDPCSGCLHPHDDAGGENLVPTVSFVSFWAGLAMAVRLVREAVGYPYRQDHQQLWLTPLRMDQARAAILGTGRLSRRLSGPMSALPSGLITAGKVAITFRWACGTVAESRAGKCASGAFFSQAAALEHPG